MNSPLRGRGLLSPDRNRLDLPAFAPPPQLGKIVDPKMLTWDYRSILPPVYDQGGVGICCVESLGSDLEAIIFKRTGLRIVISKRGVYSLAKHAFESDILAEQGLYPSDAIRTLEGIGYVLESDWPETNDATTLLDVVPPNLIRKGHLAKGYVRVASPTVENICLAGYHGGPVALDLHFGGTWDTWHATDAQGRLPAKRGKIAADDSDTHEILAVARLPEVMPGYTLIRNSWGTAWGLHGYAWMPDAAFDEAPALDAVTLIA